MNFENVFKDVNEDDYLDMGRDEHLESHEESLKYL